MAKKKNDLEGLELDQVVSENLDLMEENLRLSTEVDDICKQNQLLVEQITKMEDRYNEEHKMRVEAKKAAIELEEKVVRLTAQLEASKELRKVEQGKRHGSIPKFVIVAAVALVVLMASFALQKVCAIGPSVGFGIQCGASMVISWCYAIIFDRSRK